MLLAATANGALANIEKHKVEEDYVIDLDLTGENALGEPAVTLTMKPKVPELRYGTSHLWTYRRRGSRRTKEEAIP